MDKSLVGRVTIMIGSLFLSLQLYGLKILQLLEKQSGSWQTNAIDYAWEMPVLLSLGVTVAIIAYGIVLVTGTEKIY